MSDEDYVVSDAIYTGRPDGNGRIPITSFIVDNGVEVSVDSETSTVVIRFTSDGEAVEQTYSAESTERGWL